MSMPVKRRTSFLGLPINVEIDAGDTKSGINEAGEKWETTYLIPYGEIDRTLALSDGDPVDVYLGPFELQDVPVFVVHQLKKDGSFDEDKVMLGFPGAAEAADAYRMHGPPWGFGMMDTMSFDQFVHGYLASNRASEHLEISNTSAGRAALGKARYGT